MDLLEWVQQRWTIVVRDMMIRQGEVEWTGFVDLGEEKAHLGGLINVCKYLMGWCKEDRTRLFSMLGCKRKRVNGHKWKYSKFHLNVGFWGFFCFVLLLFYFFILWLHTGRGCLGGLRSLHLGETQYQTGLRLHQSICFSWSCFEEGG